MARSRFLRRTGLILTSTSTLVAVGLGLALLASLALRFADRPRILHIAIGPADSADAKFGEALGRELPRGFGSSKVVLVRENSLEEISDAVDSGKAELAIVRSDVAVPKEAGTMLIVHKDAALFIARPDSKITSIADLDGKKVGIVPGDDANVALLDAVLAHNGIDAEKVEHVPLALTALADAVARDAVDAIVVLYPLGSSNLQAAVRAMGGTDDKPPVFLEIKNAEAYEAGQWGFEKMAVPSGLFAGAPPQPGDDVDTIGVSYQLVARLDMSEAAVDDLTRTIFARRRALATTAPIARFMTGANTEKGSRFPLHVGATSYYQDTEKSFMDRYGDWFYIAAMVFGGFGSVVASLISSVQARSRRRAMAIIDQLTELRRKAAACQDTAALRALDRDVSELALNALHRAREGRFDGAGLDILRLATDETRRAITRRLSELRSTSAAPGEVLTAPP